MQSLAVGLVSSAHDRDIWAYRLPSLISAVLAVLATFWGGQALVGRRAAFLGAGVLATCLLLTTEAHIAKTDAALCGFTALGMAALARLRAGPMVSGGGKMEAVLFWVCFAIGVLLKGVITPMVFGLMLASLALWERKWDWMKPLLYWVGLSLFCIIAIPWFIAVQIATGGEFLYTATTVDLGQKIVSAAEGHRGPFGMHLAALPLLFWPGTILLIPAVWLAIRKAFNLRDNPFAAPPPPGANAVATTETADASTWRFLICWFLPAWLVFEIAPTKLVHYTLPMYPALALAVGITADRWFSSGRLGPERWASLALFAVLGLVLAALPTGAALDALRADYAGDYGAALAERVGFLWRQMWSDTGVGIWPTLFILTAVAGTIYAFVVRNPTWLMTGVLACAIMTGVSYRAMVLPNQTWMLSSEAAVGALTEICALPEGTKRQEDALCTERPPKLIRAIDFAEPSFVFMMGGKVVLPPDTRTVIPPVEEDYRPAWLIDVGGEGGGAALGELVKAANEAGRCLQMSRRYVYNYSNGEAATLIAAVVEPAGCVTADAAASPAEPEEEPELER
jgi:4-amino-4-deoxy-L-arabinose transferase-like glycosyltransferase